MPYWTGFVLGGHIWWQMENIGTPTNLSVQHQTVKNL